MYKLYEALPNQERKRSRARTRVVVALVLQNRPYVLIPFLPRRMPSFVQHRLETDELEAQWFGLGGSGACDPSSRTAGPNWFVCTAQRAYGL